ncbi:hypothetical protein Tco_0761172 [Tanacetum coccineum]
MMTARKRVRPLPVQQLAMRHYVDHSSSDYFSPDDSARNSSSYSSSDFHSDASSDSSSRHSLPDHSSPDLLSTSAGPSRKRRRSPMTSVPALPPVAGAISPVRADLIPSPKRIRDSGYLADVEVDPRETSLRDDVIVRGREVDDDVKRSEEPHSELEIDPVKAVIEACFDFADIIRASGVDVRVTAMTVAQNDVETSTRDPDCEAILAHRVQVIEGVQREQGHRIVGVESAVTALTEKVVKLERDNRRLKGTASVESQRVDRL